MKSDGHVVAGVRHGRRCACLTCDPKQVIVAAARAAAAAAPPPAATAPRPRPRPISYRDARDEKTRALQRHLEAGLSFSAAAQLIEAEFSPKPGEP